MSLYCRSQCACDHGCEKKTETTELRQHLARLLGGNGCINWSLCPANLYYLKNIPSTWWNKHRLTIYLLHVLFLVAVTLSSALHLMLVTCERLIAIKYTFVYPYLVTTQNIKVTVTAFWVLALCCTVLRRAFVICHGDWAKMGEKIGDAILFIVLIS